MIPLTFEVHKSVEFVELVIPPCDRKLLCVVTFERWHSKRCARWLPPFDYDIRNVIAGYHDRLQQSRSVDPPPHTCGGVVPYGGRFYWPTPEDEMLYLQMMDRARQEQQERERNCWACRLSATSDRSD